MPPESYRKNSHLGALTFIYDVSQSYQPMTVLSSMSETNEEFERENGVAEFRAKGPKEEGESEELNGLK